MPESPDGPPTGPSSRPLAGRRVLVVEDDYLIASEMARTLRCAGAEVLGPWPGTGQALESLGMSLGAPGLDAAVLDIHLSDGDDVYPVARRLDRMGVPFVFATGNVLGADDPAFRDRPRVEKPVSDRVLIRAVAALLA